MFDYLKPSPFLRDTSLLTLLEAATWLQTSTEGQIMQCISKIGEICLGNWKQPQPTDMCVDCLWVLLKKQLCNWDVTFIGGVLDLWFATLAAYSNHLGSFWHYRGWTPPSDVCFHCSWVGCRHGKLKSQAKKPLPETKCFMLYSYVYWGPGLPVKFFKRWNKGRKMSHQCSLTNSCATSGPLVSIACFSQPGFGHHHGWGIKAKDTTGHSGFLQRARNPEAGSLQLLSWWKPTRFLEKIFKVSENLVEDSILSTSSGDHTTCRIPWHLREGQEVPIFFKGGLWSFGISWLMGGMKVRCGLLPWKGSLIFLSACEPNRTCYCFASCFRSQPVGLIDDSEVTAFWGHWTRKCVWWETFFLSF